MGKNNVKSSMFSFRITPRIKEVLEIISEFHDTTQSDMIHVLIQNHYDLLKKMGNIKKGIDKNKKDE